MTILQGSVIQLDPINLQFSVFSQADVKKLSVARIVTPITFDAVGHPLPGGLYDPAMGPATRDEICSTCMKGLNNCEGHLGHIELCLPVFNPFFIKTVHNILKISCLSCFHIQLNDRAKELVILQLRLVDAGYIVEAQELEVYKVKVSARPDDPAPELFNEYTEMLLKEPYNKLANTKNSEQIRTAIVNSTAKDAVRKDCLFCKKIMKKVKFSYQRLVFGISKAEMKKFYEGSDQKEIESRIKATNQAIFAEECQKYFHQIHQIDSEFLTLLFPILINSYESMVNPMDVFFMTVVPVTPPVVRPVNKLATELLEHPQTACLKNILNANAVLKAIVENILVEKGKKAVVQAEAVKVFQSAKGESSEEKLYIAWNQLQTYVDQLLDSTIGASKYERGGVGLKQIIEKKEGLIRMHMMGKRVNYAARTVITPDPNIGVDEIGIPEKFATKLTFPTPVTPWNIAELRRMVINGPDIHPGATVIEESNGFLKKISAVDKTQRQSLAKTLMTPHSSSNKGIKTVHRHLVNGDILLLNRQPSLHKPSIMAHKARILRGEKTFRLHYSNCKSYNADFDGDEMNAHFPQNQMGRSEAYNLVNVSNNYLVPKDGTPLGGLIQDHIISGVKLFIRGRFYSQADYQQLVFQGLSHMKGNITMIPPTILRPKVLYSGKQIISTIVQNVIPKNMPKINLTSTSKLNSKSWQMRKPREWKAGGTPLKDNEMTETEVIIRDGELLSGILDKNHFGATPYGLIHCMYELYGGDCSTQLLSALSRLFTYFLQWEGFTLGVHDILVLEKADKKRSEIIKNCRNAGKLAAASALELPENVNLFELSRKMDEAYLKDPKFRVILDRKYKTVLDSFTNDINKTCLPAGLLCKFPENNLQLMVSSGAKGSTVNTMQISCLLGQIELEGKRPPLMMSGRSLPSFATFETSPKSGGFIDGRFMTGIQPQDFFFHCMAGREGLIDTAVKTSRSGYLQRCLVKHLEGLSVQYDMTVRDSDQSIVQFMYGEDGLDIQKSQFLNKNQMAFLDANKNTVVREEIVEKLKNDDDLDEQLRKHVKKMKMWKKKHGNETKKRIYSAFTSFSGDNRDSVAEGLENPMKMKVNTGRTKLTQKLIKKWSKTDEDGKKIYMKKSLKYPDPVTTKLRPDTCFGSVSEYLENLSSNYTKNSEFRQLINVKGMTSLAAPGEPVGLLAAQSIGEPSTQMTLNTFHFAGRGEMNVTLGIPRLREILMMASKNIKTPSMEIPFLKQSTVKKQEKIADKMRLRLNRVTVADVLESIDVKSRLVLKPSRGTENIIRFKFLPKEAYEHDYRVEPKEVLKYMSRSFFKFMFRVIQKKAKDKNVLVEIEQESTRRDATSNLNDDDIDDREPSSKSGPAKDDDSSDDEDPMAEDADATESKLKGKHADEFDYDEKEASEEEKEDDSFENEDDSMEAEENAEEVVDVEKEGEEKQHQELLESKKIYLDEMLERKSVLANDNVSDYSYDKEKFLWCEIKFHLSIRMKNVDFSQIFKDVSSKCVIWEVPQIKKAITYTQNEQLMLKTDGIHIAAMTKYDKILDLNRLYSNDIFGISKTYGIEAAARCIVKEVQNVFNVYGITINPRHLLLIADYMTCDGTFQPLSRKGMEYSASPLQQISFESSLQFLKAAALKGCEDNLDSPSSRLIVGQLCKTGTGAFSLYSSKIPTVN